MDESRGGGTSWLEGELVGKIEARRGREEGGINVIMDNNVLQDF
jgi:hypothetical protein